MRTPGADNQQELLSLQEAADYLYVSKSTLYRLLDQHKLRAMKAGKQWRFRRDDLLAYMQRSPAAQSLAGVSQAMLDGELAFFAGDPDSGAGLGEDDELDRDEESKIRLLVERQAALLLASGGTDLHIEPIWDQGEEQVLIRMRVNADLREVRRMPFAMHEPVVLEWKRLAGLSVDERGRPQEGAARMTLDGKPATFRVSVVPTLYGPKVAVRSISSRVPSLDDLSLGASPLERWLTNSQGLILFTGPTGSGKSTLMAACIRQTIGSGVNIMSVEDEPVYLFPPGVTQLRAENYSCAEGVRALMAQDADVIAVWELSQDPDLARASVAAAETGRLVMACMHAHGAVASLYALLDCGVSRSLAASNTIGVVNQHLLRLLCPACKRRADPDPDLLALVRKTSLDGGYAIGDSAVFYVKSGCDLCRGTGYSGKRAMSHEYFAFTPGLKASFLSGASQEQLTRETRASGQISGFAAAIKKAVETEAVALDDVLRVSRRDEAERSRLEVDRAMETARERFYNEV